MRLYTLHTKQKLPITVDEAWDFFSDPGNLNVITPDNMKFRTLSGDKQKMFAGQIIHYRISPFPLITMQWVTEITHVQEKSFFVDEQRFGPYKFWHHKHFFKAIEGGVEMEDVVHYQVPFGVLGESFHPLIVKPRLKAIFDYRKAALIKRFGEYDPNIKTSRL
ncbi:MULTISPECIES: SRPBCC family protein [unclassified Flavobacterium]|uniref:SRPBCC family protein n=1 Tax=unclassified Flavobacterium TaxID=196869 RepID=UPI0009683352|nr:MULTISPECIES: SRPBCC family protein [unclassified Flavobacterium]MBN9284758.1 SRPBCC family protein [Flavobacterium sp.]OJV71260.1 MAG: cell division inhibitor [Flavobacterium sp. 40-81]